MNDVKYLVGLTANLAKDRENLLSELPYGTKFKVMGRYDSRFDAEKWVAAMVAKGAQTSPLSREPQEGKEFWVYIVKTNSDAVAELDLESAFPEIAEVLAAAPAGEPELT